MVETGAVGSETAQTAVSGFLFVLYHVIMQLLFLQRSGGIPHFPVQEARKTLRENPLEELGEKLQQRATGPPGKHYSKFQILVLWVLGRNEN